MGNRYGNYQQEPEESTVGTAAYPQKIYNSWDSNWRCFVGTTLIIGLEEQTWPWVKKELSKAFKGGYPENPLDGWILHWVNHVTRPLG
jgi:hypothetical protein